MYPAGLIHQLASALSLVRPLALAGTQYQRRRMTHSGPALTLTCLCSAGRRRPSIALAQLERLSVWPDTDDPLAIAGKRNVAIVFSFPNQLAPVEKRGDC